MKNDIIKDISVLYELSLSIGRSLDLSENCNSFLTTLLARKNLDFASVWIKNKYLPKIKNNKNVSLVYVNPEYRVTVKSIPEKHPVFRYLKNNDVISFNYKQKEFKKIVFEKNIDKGTFAVFALGEIGFLKLYSGSSDSQFTKLELNKLINVIDKFTQSINGCLFLEKSIIETRERNLAEEKFRGIVESAQDIIYRVDRKGNFTYINPIAERVTGYTEKQILTMNYLDIIRPDYQERVRKFYSEQIKQKKLTAYFEFPIINKMNKEIWIGQNVQIIKSQTGRIEEILSVARDITERVNIERAREELDNRLRSLLDNSPDFIVSVDRDGKILFINRVRSLASIEDYIGTEVYNYLPAEQHKEYKETLDKTYQTGKVHSIDLTGLDNSWYITRFVPILKNSIVTSVMIIATDISERKRMEEALIIEKQKAEASTKAKEQFLANMSHEIRTPISAIIGMIKLINKSELSEKHQKYCTTIDTSANNLLSIINDVLDISKIEQGKLTLEKTGFNLDSIIQALYNSIGFKAEEKNIEFHYSKDDGVNDVLIGDPVKISQVLLNLVDNAIKFTDKGFVKLEYKLIKSTGKTNTIKFTVKDTGIGIDKDKIDMVFETFSQEDDSTTRKYGGSGLGLPISSEIVNLMGGELFVNSEKGKGSQFIFTLTFNKGSEQDLPSTEQANLENIDLTDIKVLLVEDNQINQFLTVSILEERNALVDIAENGEIAISKVKSKQYDVILMDMLMPVMGGIETTKILRSTLKSDIPIIALTANALKETRAKCLKAGMNDFITKPFEPYDLLIKICDLLKIDCQISPVSVDIPKKEDKAEIDKSRKLYDLVKLEKMLQGDKTQLKKMVNLFLEQIPEILNELNTHFANKELNRVSALAHKMKPSADIYGISDLKSEIRLIEQYAAEESHLDELPALIDKMNNVFSQVFKQMEAEKDLKGLP